MYAPAGKTTMKESDLTASLSWKQGFLTQKLQGKHATQALPQVKEERILKIHCPLIGKTQTKLQ